MKNDTITAYTIDIIPRERIDEESQPCIFPLRGGGLWKKLPRYFNQLRALWKKLPRFDSLCPPSIHITFFIKR